MDVTLVYQHFDKVAIADNIVVSLLSLMTLDTISSCIFVNSNTETKIAYCKKCADVIANIIYTLNTRLHVSL